LKKAFLLMIIGSVGLISAPGAMTRNDYSNSSYGLSSSDHSIPSGSTPVVDGAIKADEWADAASVFIDVEKGWRVKVFYKRDSSSLFFAFSGLKNNGKERYPEIMIDAKGDRADQWKDDDWWLHISYNDCEGKGRYNVWDCTPTKPGWTANNFPKSSVLPPTPKKSVWLSTSPILEAPMISGPQAPD